MDEEIIKQIATTLLTKSSNKQFVYRNTQEVFKRFKNHLKKLVEVIAPALKAQDPNVCFEYKEINDFEVQLAFSGDVLVFSMHTNVFTFDEGHFIHTLDYVTQDPNKAFCGLIEIYNFLYDSLRYQRMSDTGYMICRVFINKENKVIIEGERPIVELNQGFEKTDMTDDMVQYIVDQSILYALDFDLWAPPMQNVKEITVQQKIVNAGLVPHQTSKRLGFKMKRED